jgi:hypothetical protein
MGMGAENLMRDASFTKKGIEFLVLPSPIRLDSDDLAIKLSFNETLKLKKIFERFRFGMKQIDLCEFTTIIYKTDIVFLVTKTINCKTPYIKKVPKE